MINNPYENLFIYYLNGIPDVEKIALRNNAFLGTWVDEEISFLFFSSPSDDTLETILEKNPGVSLIE